MMRSNIPLFAIDSSSGSKRKRTPRPTSLTEAERAEQVFADHEAEDMDDHRVNVDLSARLDCGMGYGGEDSDEFDRGYTVEGRIEPHMIDGFLHGEENRQFKSKV